MKIEIRARGLTIGAALRAQVERRAAFALDRFSHRVGRVVVRFSDANGPRGGEDKICAVEVALRSTGTVRVRDTASDLGVAVDRTLRAAARSVARTIDRERRELLDLLDTRTTVPGRPPSSAVDSD